MGRELVGLVMAGGLGALSRYGLTVAIQRVAPAGFPYGTFVVNTLGCFLFGLLYGAFARRELRPEVALIVLTGFMGAFTTFSTYWFETSQLLQSGRFGAAAVNFLGQNSLGLLGVSLGLVLGRHL